MNFKETRLKGAYIVEFVRMEDERGFFSRSWCAREFEEVGLNNEIRQINTSFTEKRGTIRGLHYQVDPYQETKLIRCTSGKVFDVMVDLRTNSDTFLQWFGMELSADTYQMVYVPENFAHGFLTLEDNSEVVYPVSQFYTPDAERGIRFDDPLLAIAWPIPVSVFSEKDISHPDIDAAAI